MDVTSPFERQLQSEIDFVYRSLRRMGVGRNDAEDLAQDVFVVAWRRRGEFDHQRSLRPWLAGIAYRVAISFSRRQRREVAMPDLDPEDETPSPERVLHLGRARRLFLSAFAQLGTDQRALVELHDLDGMQMKEIANLLGIPLFAAYTRLRRARLRLAHLVSSLQKLGQWARTHRHRFLFGNTAPP